MESHIPYVYSVVREHTVALILVFCPPPQATNVGGVGGLLVVALVPSKGIDISSLIWLRMLVIILALVS